MPSLLDEPAMVLGYGASGLGKTCDLVYSFPRALFVGPPTAFVMGPLVVGYKPAQITTARHLDDVIAILEREALELQKTKKRKYDALIIDDLSLFSDVQFGKFIAEGKEKYVLWDAFRKILLRLREVMSYAGMHVIFNAHERGPHTDDKKGWVAGGPALPGIMPVDMPKAFTAVFRVIALDQSDPTASAIGWPYIYSVDENDQTYVTKNRFGLYGQLPMNLGEMMRLFFGVEEDGKFSIRRHPKLDWQEASVEKMAQRLAQVDLASEEHKALRVAMRDQCMMKYGVSKKIARWTVRDARHRAIFRMLQARSEDAYL